MDGVSFSAAFETAVTYVTGAAGFLSDIWDIFPDEVQAYLLAAFIIVFGIAAITKVLSMLT